MKVYVSIKLRYAIVWYHALGALCEERLPCRDNEQQNLWEWAKGKEKYQKQFRQAQSFPEHQMVHKWTGFKELQQHIIKDNQYIDGADVYDLLQGESQLHGTRSCGFRQLVVAALLVPLLVEIMVEMVKSRNKTNQKGGQKVGAECGRAVPAPLLLSRPTPELSIGDRSTKSTWFARHALAPSQLFRNSIATKELMPEPQRRKAHLLLSHLHIPQDTLVRIAPKSLPLRTPSPSTSPRDGASSCGGPSRMGAWPPQSTSSVEQLTSWQHALVDQLFGNTIYLVGTKSLNRYYM